MCRLAYVPKPSVVGKDRLEELFTHLELAQGGHGNGLANTKSGRVIKGLDVATESLAKIASQFKSPAVFHTRMASCGQPSDELCHPFSATGRWTGVVAHNGHWNDGVVLAGLAALRGRVVSDSQAFAELLGEFGVAAVLKHRWPDSGVWLICQRGGDHLVVAKSGDIRFDPATGIWASEFPAGFSAHDYEVEHGTYRLDMANPPTRKMDWTFGFCSPRKGMTNVKQMQVRSCRRVQLPSVQ